MTFINLRQKSICRLSISSLKSQSQTLLRQRRDLHTWLKTAAANPAIIPLPRLMVNLLVGLKERRVSSDMDRNAISWHNSLTVNCPMAYGICLHSALWSDTHKRGNGVQKHTCTELEEIQRKAHESLLHEPVSWNLWQDLLHNVFVKQDEYGWLRVGLRECQQRTC